MSIEDTLRDALQRDAADLVPVGSGPENARRRASLRKRRMQSGVVALSAFVLVGGTLAVIESRPSGSGPRVATASQAVTPELVWKSVDGTVANSFDTVTSSDGVTYELSTAPGAGPAGNAPQPQSLYSTHDGEHWTETSLGATPWVQDLAANDGVLYAVSTGPGTAASPIAYNLSTSSDGGSKWSVDQVPVTFTKPAASVPLQQSTSIHVARGSRTTVVLASTTYSPDFSSVLGKDASYDATAAGVQALDTSACKAQAAGIAAAIQAGDAKAAVASKQRCKPTLGAMHPWSEFGISDQAALTQRDALVRDDGGQWQPVTLPGTATAYADSVAATTNGFLVAEQDNGGVNGSAHEVLLSSTDGRTWTQLANTPAVDSVSISGDKVIGLDSTSGTLYVSNDAGSSWTSTASLGSLLPGSDPVVAGDMVIDAGPLGYAVVVRTGHAEPGGAPTVGAAGTPVTLQPNVTYTATHDYLLNSADGTTWNTTDLAAVGEAKDAQAGAVTVGKDHIDVSYQVGATLPNGTQGSKAVDLVGTPKA